MTSSHQHSAFETVAAAQAGETVPGLLFLCDHASNRVPEEIAPLGLPDNDMQRHIAWDIGARAVTLAMASELGAPAILTRFSRLVIDPNRAEYDPTLVMKLYDGSIIPGNRSVDPNEVERRLELFHRPYHRQVKSTLDAMIADNQTPAIVSMHSFTPRLRGKPDRPWHVGLLWDRDDRLFHPVHQRLSEMPDLVVGDNQPYTGRLSGDCMYMHGTSRGIAHLLIEIRNDLIDTPTGQAEWAARLSPVIKDSIAEMRLAQA